MEWGLFGISRAVNLVCYIPVTYMYQVCALMVTDLWAFVYPIGYNGKIELRPKKSRNEDAVT